MEYRDEPSRGVRRDFGILEKVDDDAEETEDTSGGDEAAGVECAGAGFAFVFFLSGGVYEHSNETTGEHGGGGAEREIRSGCESERADAKNFYGDDEGDSHENKAPWETLIEDAADDGSHQAGLRSRSFGAADALRPLIFDSFCARVVEIFAVGNFVRAEGVEEFVMLAAEGERFAFDFHADRKRLNVHRDLSLNVFFETAVHEIQRAADGESGDGDPDEKSHLLPERSGADKV